MKGTDGKMPTTMPAPLSLHNKQRKKGRGRKVPRWEKEETVRKVCAGELKRSKRENEGKGRAAKEFAQTFAMKYASYHRCFPKDWRKVLEENRGILGCCYRGAIQADAVGVSFQAYVEAQFWFFDKVFGRAPNYAEVASPKAPNRVEQWQAEVAKGKASKRTIHAATGGTLNPSKTTAAEEQKYNEITLRGMILDWGSEDVVWEMFGEIGDEEVFPDEFKRQFSVWRRMYLGEEE